MKETREIAILGLLVALAVVLRGFEGMIPNPFPWVRIGLANMMTLLSILLFGVKAGVVVTVLRVLIASFLFGTFLSPTFLISFTAGLGSAFMMGVAYRWGKPVLSVVGISVLGGFVHNLIQLLVAYLVIVKHREILYLFPVLSLIGIVTGGFNGWIVRTLYDHIRVQLPSLQISS